MDKIQEFFNEHNTTFKIYCPYCKNTITEKSFKDNEKNLSYLKEYFSSLEEKYKKEILVTTLQQKEQEWQENSQKTQKLALAEKENEFLELKQQEVNKIQNQNQEKINELQKQQQTIISQLQKQINEQKLQLETNNKTTENLLAKKENEFLELKQQEVNKIQNQNQEKLNDLQKQQQAIINQLQKQINEQKLQLETNKASTENLLTKKEKEFLEVKQQEINKIQKENQEKIDELKEYFTKQINLLNEQKKDLEIANVQHKVIQNKIKGETFEHDVEGMLRQSFEPEDIIEKITTGEKKADYFQTIRDENKTIGTIVYEVKNAEWSNNWEKKLLEDMGRKNSKYGILVATSFNQKFNGVPFKRSDSNSNIYFTDAESFIFVAQMIKSLIKTEHKIKEKYVNYATQEEKISQFREWKETKLPIISNSIEESIKKIEETENKIISNVEKISASRKKILKEWTKNVKNIIESLII